jgi:hypothetical protein
MKKIKEIINYCKTIGIVKIKSSQFGDYYGLPELSDDSWFMRVFDNGKMADVASKILIIEGYIDTVDVKPFNYFSNYKYHFKQLIDKAHKLELQIKKLKEEKRIAELDKDFD